MNARLKSSCSFPIVVPEEQRVNTTINTFLDNGVLSTSEFSGGHKPEVVLRICHPPEINRQAPKHKNVYCVGNPMPKVERFCRLVFLGHRLTAPIHNPMQVL